MTVAIFLIFSSEKEGGKTYEEVVIVNLFHHIKVGFVLLSIILLYVCFCCHGHYTVEIWQTNNFRNFGSSENFP